MDTKNAQSHISLIGALHIGYGAVSIFGALITFLSLKFAFGFIPDLDEIPIAFVQAISSFIPIILVFFGTLNLIAGIAIFSKQEWSRIFIIIVSTIKIFNIPIGTALGVYSIWAMVQPEVQDAFR